ncbi:MAG: 2-octaprenyl-6-methoxyphenol hydroxylase [Alteromonadaceae bacterium]|jgi:2-octaprenyl-6-methoxyphenol hydroxylase
MTDYLVSCGLSDAEQYDIVIAGGGLVGASVALAISQTNPQLRIAIVEAVPPSAENQPSYDSRAIAVAHGSRILLDDYGWWSALKHKVEPIVDIQVSDRGHIGKSYLTASQFNLAALGYVLEVRHLGQILIERLKAFRHVQWFCPDSIGAIDTFPSHLTLTLSSEKKLRARLLLVADGGQSLTRQRVNIDNHSSDYGQCAVITNISISQPHQNRAFERFTEFGPMALLPLSGDRYSLVWCVTPNKVQPLLDCDEQQFLAQLQQAFGYRAGQFVKAGQRFSYPLTLTLAKEITSHRVALMGNASHTIHPIAGQGFNLGLRDVEAIRQCINSALINGQDIGEFATLAQFSQLRQQDMNQVVGMTDTLVRLFSNSDKALALGRTMGLLTMGLFDCLKQPLAYQAMGVKSKLMKGVKTG